MRFSAIARSQSESGPGLLDSNPYGLEWNSSSGVQKAQSTMSMLDEAAQIEKAREYRRAHLDSPEYLC